VYTTIGILRKPKNIVEDTGLLRSSLNPQSPSFGTGFVTTRFFGFGFGSGLGSSGDDLIVIGEEG
jgi:hypothetical protein